MKLIAQLKLLPMPEQAGALKRMLEVTNAACNYISDLAWQTRTFGKFALQKLCYQDVREQFGLSAQVVIRALAKVGDAYKLDKKTKRAFRPLASIAYDDRILSWNLHEPSVSIWTVAGRLSIPFLAGERQMQMLQFRMGETDLVYHRGNWYLLATCEVQEPDPQDVDDVLGIDLGVTNIATDSDGTIYSGSIVKGVRYHHRRLRNKLQKKEPCRQNGGSGSYRGKRPALPGMSTIRSANVLFGRPNARSEGLRLKTSSIFARG